MVVVNNSVRLAPWADVLFANDVAWWRVFGPAVAAFRGLRVAGETSATPEPGVRYISSSGCRSHFTFVPGQITDFMNSGAAAINLALNFGARRIACPVLALWSARFGGRFDVLGIWRDWADDVRGRALECGHFLPEEAPEETAAALREFFLG